MQQQIQQLQQQQPQLPLGRPVEQSLTQLYQQYSNSYMLSEANIPFGRRYQTLLQVSEMAQIQIQSNKQLDVNRLINFQSTPDTQILTIKYGSQNKQLILNKTYLMEEYICRIPYDYLDLSVYSQNILDSDFESFIHYILQGQLGFYSSKVPTFICLFAVFQMHLNLKEIINQLLDSFQQHRCYLHQTQSYDDLLLYHLFENYTYDKASYSGFMNLALTQQWLMIQQDLSWFSFYDGQIFEISPLFKQFNESQLQTVLNSLYFYERIQYFNTQKFQRNFASDALYVIIGLNKIINLYYNNQSILDPVQRTQHVYTLLNQYLPLDKNIDMVFFKQVKDFYDQKIVNEILISQIEKLQKQVDQLEEEKVAYIFTSKLSLYQLQNHQQ
ncbi:hypothetical protein ABPG74_014397 [Tetrahymena malaccensis]